MKYTGLHQQIQRNNINSFLLLIAFPALLLGMFYVIIYFITGNSSGDYGNEYQNNPDPNTTFLTAAPIILIAVGIWFLIAWAGHAAFIRLATGAKSLDRIENKRVYNLVENLCI